MSDKKDLIAYEDYGVVSKAPMELIEEFTTNMMMQHMIHVTGIQFDEHGMTRIENELISKTTIRARKSEDEGSKEHYNNRGYNNRGYTNTKSMVIALPCGYVDINEKEEHK